MQDLIIVGGGPAGATAAVYAARKQLKTTFVTSEWGGQSTVSEDIQNWIGSPHISGADLAKNLKAHVEEYAADHVRIIAPALAQSLKVGQDHVTVTLNSGEVLEARSLFVATGAIRRTLDIPGAKEYEHKGLTYCASCDGPLFADQDVVVVGGGNAAFETALQLAAYCKTVMLLNRSDSYRADEVTIAAAQKNPRITLITNAAPTRVEGEKFVSAFVYTDASQKEVTLAVTGVFVEVGLLPNTPWLGDMVILDATKHVVVDPRTQRASYATETVTCRVWAAGDCTDGIYHQNNISSGDAVKALEDLYIFLHKNG
jgi:alkyl hydroperoxide reductase subunit F